MAVYRLVVIPIAVLFVMLALPFHRKLRATISLRMKPRFWPDWVGIKPTLWIHAASGEFEYAKPLIKYWREKHPDWKIYVTYFSPTYRKVVENFPGVDACGPLPLDLPGPMRSFVKKLKPNLLAVARTDLWPELTASCEARNIPVVLFSATRAPLKPWEKVFKFALRWRYEGANYIYTVSELDRAELENLQVKRPVAALGDTRYDQVIDRLKSPKPLPLKIISQRPVMICGSTWSPDEKVILPAAADLVKSGVLALILVPHEPTAEHLESLEKQIKKLVLNSERITQTSTWNSANVLLVDKIGILAELYSQADLAFVGGSFQKSVHSVMEPLAAGLATLVGPYHRNNREAVEFQGVQLAPGLSVVRPVTDVQEFKTALSQWLAHADKHEAWKTQIKNEVLKRSAATQKVAAQIEKVLTIS